MEKLQDLKAKFEEYKKLGLNLNIQRGQPADENFQVSSGLFRIMDDKDAVTPSGVDTRNYPGGITGLKEARELFCEVIGVKLTGGMFLGSYC